MFLKLISLFKIEKVLAQQIIGRDDTVVLIDPLGGKDFMGVINNVLDFLIIYIAPPLLALMILIGGFQILYAKDDPAKVQSGKNTIKYAVIGFVIILCANGVAKVIENILG